MNRILAVLIAYYPDMDLLEENMKCFVDHVDKILVWDNTPDGDPDLVRQTLLGEEKMERMGDGENHGISFVLNMAWHYAANQGYDYLLTMDQDSLFTDFPLFIEQTVQAEQAPKGIYCPWVKQREPKSDEVYQKTDYGITSGMLVSIDILNQLGGYRQDFFVDGIDIELCLHAKLLGIPTYIIANCRLHQRFGNPKTTRILGKDHHSSNYSPRRLEEIIKTHVILLRHYPCSFTLRKRIIMNYFWKLPQKLLFLEDDKWTKFRAVGRGLRQGLSSSSVKLA